MFFKISRYRKLPDIVTSDAKGRTLQLKPLRLLPEVSGTFRHTIEEVDRLDHLAYKFYKQSRKWWRICDANPEFMCPQALLGKDSIPTIIFTLSREGAIAPWSELTRALSNTVGIENVQLGTDEYSCADIQKVAGPFLFMINSGLVPELENSVLSQSLSALLTQNFVTNGVVFVEDVSIAFAGNDEWSIQDMMTKEVYSIRLESGQLNVYETILRHAWVLAVTHNEMNITAQEINGLIAAFGFDTEQPSRVSRTGKQIIIPRDVLT
ncbi:MAG: hypothetical protein JKY62_01940 [Desulfocapsa sp.]|nr:hypothetical protein [Desulfocapsa sp.]